MIHTVSISDMKATNQRNDVLITYSLGSCVGLTLFDPVAVVGGLMHCMLPLSKADPNKAKKNPMMFTDTGFAQLLESVFQMGAERNRLVAKVAGAGSILDDKGLFRIGERNYSVLSRLLHINDIPIRAENVGGTTPRTLYLYMSTGKTVIKSRDKEVEL